MAKIFGRARGADLPCARATGPCGANLRAAGAYFCAKAQNAPDRRRLGPGATKSGQNDPGWRRQVQDAFGLAEICPRARRTVLLCDAGGSEPGQKPNARQVWGREKLVNFWSFWVLKLIEI